MSEFAFAKLTPLTDATGATIGNPSPDQIITVQFNPETLEVIARNQVQEDRGKKQNKPPVQVVTSSEMSLSVQLIFDETMTGDDVRARTTKIGALMRPGDTSLEGYGENGTDKDAKIPAIVRFEWGNFRFDGTLSEFTETLEYFSDTGVPLRASVKFSMTEQGATYTAASGDDAGVDGGMPVSPDAPLPEGPDRQATQAIAQENGVENLNAPGVDRIFPPDTQGGDGTGGGSAIRGALGAANSLADASGSIGAGAGLGGGASFGLGASAVASGQIGISLSAGLDIGVGGGASAGFGGALSAGGSAGTGIDVELGAGADAGLGLDAFAGLNTPKPPGDVVGAARKLGKGAFGAGASAGISASAGFGGAGGTAGASAKAEVGRDIDLQYFLFGDD